MNIALCYIDKMNLVVDANHSKGCRSVCTGDERRLVIATSNLKRTEPRSLTGARIFEFSWSVFILRGERIAFREAFDTSKFCARVKMLDGSQALTDGQISCDGRDYLFYWSPSDRLGKCRVSCQSEWASGGPDQIYEQIVVHTQGTPRGRWWRAAEAWRAAQLPASETDIHWSSKPTDDLTFK